MPEGGSDEAQALVEFALVLPVMLMLILGLFDVARAVQQENTLAFAAREGARYAIVHGSWSGRDSQVPPPNPPDQPFGCDPCTNAAVAGVVASRAIGVPNVTTTLRYRDACNEPTRCRVAVDATAPFVPLPSQWLLNGALTITLRGGSELVIQY